MDVQPLMVPVCRGRVYNALLALASRLCIDAFQELGRLVSGNEGSLSQKVSTLLLRYPPSMLAHWFAGGLFHLLQV